MSSLTRPVLFLEETYTACTGLRKVDWRLYVIADSSAPDGLIGYGTRRRDTDADPNIFPDVKFKFENEDVFSSYVGIAIAGPGRKMSATVWALQEPLDDDNLSFTRIHSAKKTELFGYDDVTYDEVDISLYLKFIRKIQASTSPFVSESSEEQ